MPVVTMATLGILDWMKKDIPVHNRVRARKGNVNKRRFLLPHLSMVNKAGIAKTKLRIPVPMETRRAVFMSKPLSRKMLVL